MTRQERRQRLMKMLDETIYPSVEYSRRHKVYTQQRATNPELCKKCGGKCCKISGCHFSPEDFKDLSLEGLRREIEKGYIAISYFDREEWYGDTDVLYLRARSKGEAVCGGMELVSPKNQGCILLTKTGCKLPFAKRPTGGRNLIPKFDQNCRPNCEQTYDRIDCAREWLPYKRTLSQLADEFKSRDIKCAI